MCGIVGHFRYRYSQAELSNIIPKQLDTIRYRGPDGDGVFIDDLAALGHVRLSIIDLMQGAQPLLSQDGALAVTFNGEIYNYIELRKTLEKKGHRFLTNSDTEVLLLSYREWGENVVLKLNGMFAFAIYDKAEKKLFCARDPFGQKPFFYFKDGSSFHFASEVKAFFPLPNFVKAVDRSALVSFLRFEALYNDASIFKGVKKLPPGHSLTISENNFRITRYFMDVPVEIESNVAKVVEETDTILKDAVKIAFRADVPVGVLLSGGLDSSLVLAALRAALPSSDISAYHIHMADNPTYDESAFAKAVAKHCNSRYTEINFTLAEMANVATEILPQLDEPQADPGLLAKYTVCRALSSLTKVALTGDGADELFYGYISFKAQRIAKYYRYLPAAFHRFAGKTAQALPAAKGYMQFDFLAKHFTKGFPSDEALRNARWTASFSETEIESIFRDKVAGAAEDAIEYLYRLDSEAKHSGYLGKLSYLYQNTYLPDYVLKNSDRVSMLNSVELRAPLLDPRLAAIANSAADAVKMRGFQSKSLLKRVAERHLPKELVHRKKIGFTIPAADLIRKDLRREIEQLFSPDLLKRQGIFESQPIQDILKSHFSEKSNNYKQIWTLYALQKWLVENNLN